MYTVAKQLRNADDNSVQINLPYSSTLMSPAKPLILTVIEREVVR